MKPTSELEHPPFTTPDEIWEGTFVKAWSFLEQGEFLIELTFVAGSLIYCEQHTINRVKEYVRDVLAKANAQKLSHKEAVQLVKREVVFTKEELETIDRNAVALGEMMAKFYQKRAASN